MTASLPPLGEARASGYARLERGDSIVIADVGRPPPLALSASAQAGCLSFEMSVGTQLLFVNGGVPGRVERRLVSRGARHGEPQRADAWPRSRPRGSSPTASSKR